ncbi:unnamed protein product, partial [Ectocarpus sp. 13 AM-2016]
MDHDDFLSRPIAMDFSLSVLEGAGVSSGISKTEGEGWPWVGPAFVFSYCTLIFR